MLKQLNNAKNGRMVLYVVLLVLAVTLMVMLKNCHSAAPLPGAPVASAHSGGDTLDVAIEYSPASYYTYNDTLGGFNYDMLRILSVQMHRPMKFHPITTLSVALEGIDRGDYDLLAAQFPMTSENQKQYLFTTEVYLDRQVLVQRTPVKVKSQLDLAGDTLWIVKDSPMAERIGALSREIGDSIHVASEAEYGPEQLFLSVATGEIKYAVINNHIASELAKKYQGKVDVSTSISFTQFQAWVLKRGNTNLANALNAQIKAFKTTPKYQELINRYF